MSRLTIPDCFYCGSSKISHEVDRDDEGEPTNAWFECRDCEAQWNNFALSEKLLAADVMEAKS